MTKTKENALQNNDHENSGTFSTWIRFHAVITSQKNILVN